MTAASLLDIGRNAHENEAAETAVQIIHGDVREKLADLADDTFHCCVTSPPYWGMRDYVMMLKSALNPEFMNISSI